MREILFRGKRKDNGEWIAGYLIIADERWFILITDNIQTYSFTCLKDGEYIFGKFIEVIPETVGQYTGELDKNGTKIFEGDIVDVKYNIDYVGVAKERIGMFRVVFHNGCFMKAKIKGCGLYHIISTDEHTVIGNIHDNPELLKECEGNE